MNSKFIVIRIVICFSLVEFHLAQQEIKTLKTCATQKSCQNCLEASSSCAWCSDWSYSNITYGKPRCNTLDKLKAFGCPDKEIRTASTSSVEYLENVDFQDVIMDQTGPVQLKPQKVHLRIRPHSRETVKIQYRPAKNYPLDLYYLMDLTWSMRDDKETLVGLGRKMANTLGTFTTNFRLGFGSYADKPLMPYIFPGHEDNPCKSEHATCAPLYSFKHHLELTNNIQRFVQKVNSSDVTGNVDNLEGGLDGVAQAIVCTEQIGWARQARKLILIATDGLLHFAGEGKLGGAVDRQDFLCHLDANGQYYLAKKYDYPSLAEVSRLLQSRKVNLIFAVTEERRQEYELIADLLEEKARVATLTSNSSNILEIVESAYHEILTKVVLRDNASEALKLEYFSNCGEENAIERSTHECYGIQEGQIYDFQVVFSVQECPKNRSLWKQRVVIEDVLASETSAVTVDVELICGCDCMDRRSTHCFHGTDECGICRCDFGWSGETCDCDESSAEENRLQCINPKSYPGNVCSGRGECVCGKCNCDNGYNGVFCECSPCDKTDGIECGGRGTCDCGVCKCLDEWEGNGCQCPAGDKLCQTPGSDDICANHGYCDCGQCRCNETAPDGLVYRGTYCESSASAGGSGLCILYNSCVNATMANSEDAKKFCTTNTTEYKIERVNTVETDHEHYCFVRTMKGSVMCTIPYIYEFQKDNTLILRIGDKICRSPISAAFLPIVLFSTVLLTGILSLLVWKCWTAIKDKREYAKFEQERRKTVYALDENPLFRPATTQFRVPSMYKED